MTELSRLIGAPGKISDPWSASGLNYRAWRAGDATAAYNQAMTCFSKRDLPGYRQWLRRAARAGDLNAARPVRGFETRLPHSSARAIGRHCPDLAHDGYWSDQRLERRRRAKFG